MRKNSLTLRFKHLRAPQVHSLTRYQAGASTLAIALACQHEDSR
jgi:hypothetical protein